MIVEGWMLHAIDELLSTADDVDFDQGDLAIFHSRTDLLRAARADHEAQVEAQDSEILDDPPTTSH